MPRRSSRLKGKAQDAEIANVESKKDIDNIASKTKETESVSNNTSQVDQQRGNKKLVIEEIEQKDPSEPPSLQQSPEQSPDQQPAEELNIETATTKDPQNESQNQDEDEVRNDEQEEEEEPQTLIAGRSKRNVKKMSYKDESSSEEEEEDDDPMFSGLSKEQKNAMKKKMAAIQKGANESTLKERALKIQEIIGAFELNIDAEVDEEEAAFIYDFSRKHQFDIIEKIEDEGDFFLDSMREMIEEKMKLHQAGIRANGGKRKRRKDEESESEFDMNDFEDDTDSDYSMDSDFENPFEDNENMIDEYEDEEDYATWGSKKRRRGGKRRRNKNIWRDEEGREYYAKGRLLLNDALKDTDNFEGWSAARVKAWKNKEVNPNAYHYRFNLPGEDQVNGPLKQSEIKPFMERVKEVGVNVHWGTFSAVIKGRVGYQCSNYWRQMMKDGWVKDPNYWILPDGKFSFKRGKKGDIPTNIRKYSFVVLKDPSGTFGPDFPAFHPKRPSDKQLKKYLETDVRDLDESTKAGKKKKKSKGRGKKKIDDDNNNDNKEQEKEEETKDDKNDNDETTDNKKEEKKSKKKGSKKKKDKKKKKSKKKNKKKNDKDDEDKENDNDNEENEESKDKKTKKKKKSKKKSKKSSKKDKKKKDKKSKKKSKKSKNDKEEEENNNDEKEGEEDTSSKSKRGKKRKHSTTEVSELEPPQKKRKKMNKAESKKEQKKDALSLVLGDMIDIMTGDKLKDPAISPYGYVMSYNSWCSILRNSKTKNQCPFTKQKLTRRSLIKLTEFNIDQYKDQIVNITEEDAKNLSL